MNKFREKYWLYIQLISIVTYPLIGYFLSTAYNNYYIWKFNPESSMYGIAYPPSLLIYAVGVFALIAPAFLSVLLVLLHIEKWSFKKIALLCSPFLTFPLFIFMAFLTEVLYLNFIKGQFTTMLTDPFIAIAIAIILYLITYFFLFKNFWQWIRIGMSKHLIWGLTLINFITILGMSRFKLHLGLTASISIFFATFCTGSVFIVLVLRLTISKAIKYFSKNTESVKEASLL